MAFNPSLLSKLEPSSLFTQPATIPNVTPQNVSPQFWLYNSGNDNTATVETNGYFFYFADWLNTLQYNNGQFFNVGDLIYCTCSDASVWLSVTQVQPQIQTLAATVGVNSVATADIQNQAVTAAKIANATITTTQISATAAITGTQLAAGANIAGTQLAAAANIAGSQLAAAAGIIGGQLANSTVTGSKIAPTTVAGSNMVNNTITATQLALSVPQTVTIAVNAATFKALYDTPLQIVAGVAGKLIVPIAMTVSMTFVSAQYTGGGVFNLEYDNVAHGAGVAASATVAAATINGWAASSAIMVAGALASSPFTSVVGKGLWLSNQSADFATGDSTFNITVSYYEYTA